MSAFENEFASEGRPELLDAFGQDVTREAPDGTTETVAAIWNPEAPEKRDDEGGRSDVKEGTLDYPTSATKPTTGDTFTIDGAKYAVRAVPDHSGGFYRLPLVRRVRTENEPGGERVRRLV